MATYQPGDFVDGYEFIGGDYKDKANWKDWGAGTRKLPDGSVVRDGPKGGMQVLKKGSGGPDGGPQIREFEAKAAAQGTLMDQALDDYTGARIGGYDPANWKNSLAMGLEGGLPKVGPYLADLVRDNPSERGRAAELAFTEGSLRALTGAAATEGEVRRNARTMFRQPGESPGVEKNKAAVRQRFADTTKRIAGPAYMPPKPQERDGIPEGWRSRLTPAQLKTSQMFKGSLAKGGTQQNPFAPTTDEEFKGLPKGAWYIDDDGKLFRK